MPVAVTRRLPVASKGADLVPARSSSVPADAQIKKNSRAGLAGKKFVFAAISSVLLAMEASPMLDLGNMVAMMKSVKVAPRSTNGAADPPRINTDDERWRQIGEQVRLAGHSAGLTRAGTGWRELTPFTFDRTG